MFKYGRICTLALHQLHGKTSRFERNAEGESCQGKEGIMSGERKPVRGKPETEVRKRRTIQKVFSVIATITRTLTLDRKNFLLPFLALFRLEVLHLLWECLPPLRLCSFSLFTLHGFFRSTTKLAVITPCCILRTPRNVYSQ